MPENSTPEISTTVNRRIEENFQIWFDRFKSKTNPNANPSAEASSQPSRPGPEFNEDETPAKKTDLYSFYSELCALRFEFRKNYQRSHEATSHFNEVLDDFSQRLQQLDLHNKKQSVTIGQNCENQIKSKIFLPLIDIYDRFRRLKDNLEKPVKAGSFWQRRQQIDELEEKIKQITEGFSILEKHFSLLLEQEGVERQVCKDKKFDPTTMTAIEVASIPEASTDQVIDEIAPGYSFNDVPLRLAKVIVNRK